MSYWNNKSAIVTGGGSGIGAALAMALAERGARVWLSDLNSAAAAAVAERIGDNAIAHTLDVTDANAVSAHVQEVVTSHGRIDAIFNNAGIGIGGDLRELNLEHFRQSLDVNVLGVVHGVLAAFPFMKAQGSGAIVNTASAAGLLALPLLAPYVMSKFAVVGLSNSLRYEAAEHGVQINVLCPMAIETPLLDTDLSRELGAPWRPDIRRYLTEVGGAPYPVDKFAAYALRQVEKDKGVIAAPLGGRLRVALGRYFPSAVRRLTRSVYRRTVATRPPD